MRKVFVFLIAVFAASTLADAAQIKTMVVSYPSGSDTVTAYLALPSTAGQHPALIVIHEWWGLTDWIRQNARDFARKGYVSLAIDLYRGKLTSNPEEAYKLMMSVPRERAATDLKAAFDYLARMKEVNPAKIGVIGWCMGGSYSFMAALELPKLAACVIDYGKVESDKVSIARVHCPVECNFAEEDKTYTPEMGRDFEEAMKTAGKVIELHIYPGVNHAFMNPNNTFGYNEKQSRIAWRNIFTFLDKHLTR
ncbi:MAG: dienelactone hydrolase family protein [Bacteroidetes bacterium]|nr:dienelactone hydrolase family protein [Bacteroidota bacterium]